jgi:hypothetical protein
MHALRLCNLLSRVTCRRVRREYLQALPCGDQAAISTCRTLLATESRQLALASVRRARTTLPWRSEAERSIIHRSTPLHPRQAAQGRDYRSQPLPHTTPLELAHYRKRTRCLWIFYNRWKPRKNIERKTNVSSWKPEVTLRATRRRTSHPGWAYLSLMRTTTCGEAVNKAHPRK